MCSGVHLAPHDPAWIGEARSEIARLMNAFAGISMRVEHIGSTSIPTIAAKPIIDLLAVVESIAALDACRSMMLELGYQWRGEHGLSRRRYCVLSDEKRRIHLHCWAEGDSEVERHLCFRDYLLAFPDEAYAYEAERRRAAAGAGYQLSKAAWIQACEKRALSWRALAGP